MPRRKTNVPQLDPSDCCKASSAQVAGGFCPSWNVNMASYNNIPFRKKKKSKPTNVKMTKLS